MESPHFCGLFLLQRQILNHHFCFLEIGDGFTLEITAFLHNFIVTQQNRRPFSISWDHRFWNELFRLQLQQVGHAKAPLSPHDPFGCNNGTSCKSLT